MFEIWTTNVISVRIYLQNTQKWLIEDKKLAKNSDEADYDVEGKTCKWQVCTDQWVCYYTSKYFVSCKPFIFLFKPFIILCKSFTVLCIAFCSKIVLFKKCFMWENHPSHTHRNILAAQATLQTNLQTAKHASQASEKGGCRLSLRTSVLFCVY